MPSIAIVSVCVWSLLLQDAAPPAGSTMPAESAITAKVIDARGDVQAAALGTNQWRPIKSGDELSAQTMIRTGLRSNVKLQIGQEEPYTVVVIESVGVVSLDEAYKTADTKRVRVGVGYGKIRAGVAEGGLKSEFTVDSPVATLSKRGTWDFGMAYERGTGRFEVFVLDRGLVDVLNQFTRERRQIAGGQRVTEAMRRWADEAQIVRSVPVVDVLGQSEAGVAFSRVKGDGLGVLSPGSGAGALRDVSSSLNQPVASTVAGAVNAPVPPTVRAVGPLLRPEGVFGTGRGGQLFGAVAGRRP